MSRRRQPRVVIESLEARALLSTSAAVLLKDLRPGTTTSGQGFTNATAVGSQVFFVNADGVTGDELWVTDGTRPGTKLVKDIRAGQYGSNPQDLVAFKGQLYFSANDDVIGRQLWRSDGTAAK